MDRYTGNQLKAARALLGINQITLARLTDVSVGTIRRLESAGPNWQSERGSTEEIREKVRRALVNIGIVFAEDGLGVSLRVIRGGRVKESRKNAPC